MNGRFVTAFCTISLSHSLFFWNREDERPRDGIVMVMRISRDHRGWLLDYGGSSRSLWELRLLGRRYIPEEPDNSSGYMFLFFFLEHMLLLTSITHCIENPSKFQS